MLPRLLRRALAAAIVTVSLVAPASSQPLPLPDAPSTFDGAGLAPLWDDAGARGHQMAARARAPLAPFVTSSVPEDALWEPFTQPGPSRGVFRIAEWHGKLVLAVSVFAAGHTPGGVVLWDGTSFEALPYPGDVQDLTIWNDQIVVEVLGPYPNYGNQAIVRYNGATWDTLGVTTNYPLCIHAFGSKLVVGGQLTAINGVPVNHIAVYDGSSWSALGNGFPSGRPIWLAVHNGTLVAAGNVSPFTGVAAWNEGLGVWQSIGSGLGGLVRSVESDGVTLYVSGRSLLAGTTDVGGLARWDGISWSAVPGATGKDVQTMTPWNGRMVASVSRSPVGLLSQWDGVSLTGIPGDSLGYGMQFGSVLYHLTTWGSRLVATGGFVTNGSACIPNLAIYDGTSWSTAMIPWDATMRSPGGVSALEAWNGKLVVAGTSVLIADQDHYMYVSDGNSVFDGTHWARLSPTPANAQYKVLGKWKGDLILAGYTLAVAGTPIRTVARWDGVSWSGFGDNPPYFPYAIQEFHGDLYLANDSEDPATTGVARWNGTSWQGLGTGIPSSGVETLCVHGDSLVAGGLFSQAGGVAANNIAFWDGAAWHTAGAGFDYIVDAVGSWNGVLVAGGRFTASGGQPMTGAAYWDGATWHQMGTNAVDLVSFEVEGGELFASGDFRLPDASVVTTVAHWIGSDWQLLGSGTNGYAFAISNGFLYDAGSGVVHGHVSHGLSRMPLGGILSAPRPQASAHIALAVSPNPARSHATFSFTLPAAGHARVTVLDLAGRRVAMLADGVLPAGPHRAEWATPGAPGVYMALLETSAGRVSRRFVVLER